MVRILRATVADNRRVAPWNGKGKEKPEEVSAEAGRVLCALGKAEPWDDGKDKAEEPAA